MRGRGAGGSEAGPEGRLAGDAGAGSAHASVGGGGLLGANSTPRTTLHVTPNALATPRRTRALASLCKHLNDTHTTYPGTTLTLHYNVAPQPCMSKATVLGALDSGALPPTLSHATTPLRKPQRQWRSPSGIQAMCHHDPKPVDGSVGAREAPQSSEGTTSRRTRRHPLQRTQRQTNTNPKRARTHVSPSRRADPARQLRNPQRSAVMTQSADQRDGGPQEGDRGPPASCRLPKSRALG